MRIFLPIIFALFAGNSVAATQYVDRPFPIPVSAGVPCFVKFAGKNVNVNFIRDISVGTDGRQEWVSSGFGGVWKPYLSLRVSFAAGYYEISSGTLAELQVAEAALLKAIKDCK